MKLLVVGGYGTFGGRLIDLLKDEPHLEILVAGRSYGSASAFCLARRDARARLVPALFDRDGDTLQQLNSLKPDLLVDASGPFQAYGAGGYRLIEACIARQVHYLDLADGSDFVAGVTAFDAAARAAGVYILSGVSTFPVLTAAVVRHLSVGMAHVASIRAGIAPSPFAGVGKNVVRAIAGYAGKPVALRENGKPSIAYPFTDSRRFTIAPPGYEPLKNTLFSLVDVPDLRALPILWPEIDDIWTGAGPVPEVLHRALIALAWVVRVRLLPSLAALAPLMFFATNHLRYGDHRGGMFVCVKGTDHNQQPIERSWHLLAEGDDGPLIPSMAVEALVRKSLQGRSPPCGARAAVTDLELDDYERIFASRSIVTGTRNDIPNKGTPLFARLLGDAWQRLPAAVRQMHTLSSKHLSVGRCKVERGRNVLATGVASLFGFPKAAADIPVSVLFERTDGMERWTRTFGKDVFRSTLRPGTARSERLLCERIGLLDFAQALVLDRDRLRLVLRRWTLLGIPLPLWMAPRSDSYESEKDGQFQFHVEISHPLLGLIVRYQGHLTLAA